MPRERNTRVWMRVAPGIGFSRSMSSREAGGFIGGALAGQLIGQLCRTWVGLLIVLPLLLPLILLMVVVPIAIQLLRLLIFGFARLAQQGTARARVARLSAPSEQSRSQYPAIAPSDPTPQPRPSFP